jgi:hypothetical protein
MEGPVAKPSARDQARLAPKPMRQANNNFFKQPTSCENGCFADFSWSLADPWTPGRLV